jgi:hypothetical protein
MSIQLTEKIYYICVKFLKRNECYIYDKPNQLYFEMRYVCDWFNAFNCVKLYFKMISIED